MTFQKRLPLSLLAGIVVVLALAISLGLIFKGCGDGGISGCAVNIVGNVIASGDDSTATCLDSDGGKNYEFFGSLNITSAVSHCTYEDYCLDSRTLRERYCDGNSASAIDHDCGEAGCESGLCKKLLSNILLQYYATDATLTAPMQRTVDSSAPSGSYISSPTPEAGKAEFYVTIPQAGKYVIWARVYSPGSSSDSFYVEVNGVQDTFHTTGSTYGIWEWRKVDGESHDPWIFDFNEASYVITFKTREAFTRLDKILVTNNQSYVPPAVEQPAASPPLSSYPMTETSGTVVADDSGHNANGKMIYGMWNSGYGIIFDGSSSRVELPVFNFPQKKFTVELWAQRSGTYTGGNSGNDATLIGSSGYYNGWRITHRDPVTSDGVILVQKGGDSNSSASTARCTVQSKGRVMLSSSTHVAGVWDGSKLYLYINGALNSSADCTQSYVSSGSKATVLGKDYYGVGTFNGIIQDVRIYDSALSASNVLYDKSHPKTPNTPAPYCGDGICNGAENYTTCPADCPPYITAPTASLTSNVASITLGQSAVLSWTTSGASSASISPGIGTVAASGSMTVAPTTTTTYTLTATGTGGTATSSTTIAVNNTAPYCGDGICNGLENCTTCPVDCGPCPNATMPLPPLPQGSVRYYVSANGDDSNSGTSESAAWRTLSKVSDRYFNAGDQIVFRRGDVFVGKLKISSSGSSDKKIYYASYGSGNKPVITTSQSVNGWSKYKDNIYVMSPGRDIRLVSVDGSFIRPAHYPASGYLTIDSMDGTHVIIDNDLSLSSDQLSNAMIHWRPWTGDTYSTNVVSFSKPRITIGSYDDGNSMIVPKSGWGYYLVGRLWMLDYAAGWAYEGGKLYVRLPNGDSPANHLIEATTPYPSGQNNNAVNADNLHDFVLQDLEVRNAIEYGIRFYGVSNAQLKNCLVRSIGKHGIDVEDSSYITVDSCTVDSTVNNGIYMEGTQGNKVINNDIRNSGTAGLEGSRGQGIYSFYGSHGNLIENNTIINVSFASILYGGHDNTIRHNYVAHYCLTLNDCGAIYTWGKSSSNPSGPNNLIEDNLVVDGFGNDAGTTDHYYMARGIYIDDMSYGSTIRNNAVIDSADYGIMIHNAHDCPVNGNLVYGTDGNPVTFYRDNNDGTTGELARNPAADNIFFAMHKGSSDDMVAVYLTQMPGYPGSYGPFNNNYFGDAYIAKHVRDQSWGVYNNLYTVSEYNAHYGNNLFTGSKLLSDYYDRSKFTNPATDSTVIYNAERASRLIALNQTYCDLYGKKISGSVMLSSFDAIILLRGDAGCSVKPAVCGDKYCESGESCSSCAADCGPCSGTTASLTSNVASITLGQSAVLSWTTSGASSASISPGIGTVAASGSMTVAPTTTTTYTLTATGTGGTATSSTTIAVYSNSSGYCGDKICNNGETYATCPGDCPPPGSSSYMYDTEAESMTLGSPMQIMSDSSAFSGKYIASPSSGLGNATLKLNLPQASTYYLWSRTLGSDADHDSFYVSVDGTERVFDTNVATTYNSWGWSKLYGRLDTESTPSLRPLDLVAGWHTITYRAREPNAKLDRIILTNNASFVPTYTLTYCGDGICNGAENCTTCPVDCPPCPPPSTSKIPIEAETGSLTSPMTILSASDASEGKYIASGTDSSGSASYSFTVPSTARYAVWARVLGPDSTSDSFFVSVDGGAQDIFDIVATQYGVWAWMGLNGRTMGNPWYLDLNAGTHTIKFSTREKNSRLDKLIITNDMSFAPSDADVTIPGQQSGSIASYPMTAASGTLVADDSGHNAHGQMISGRWNSGYGIIFDGSSSRVELPVFNFPQKKFTVELWAQRSGTYSSNTATFIGTSGYYNGWRIVQRDPVTSDGVIIVQKGGADNIPAGTADASCRLESKGRVMLSDWTHIAGVWDGATLYLYINGVLDNTASCITSYVSSESKATVLGKDDFGVGTFNGIIKDVRIYDSALSASSIIYDKDHPKSPNPITPAPYCGDGICNGAENCTTCPVDCGPCPPPIEGGSGTVPPLPAGATRYYVSAGGNDGNNGTSESSPWKTISKVNSRSYGAGDQILFRRGDYWHEELKPTSSGSDGKPIVYSYYGDSSKYMPIIDAGNVAFTGWTYKGSNLWGAKAPRWPGRIWIDGVEQMPSTYPGIISGKGAYYGYSTPTKERSWNCLSDNSCTIYSEKTPTDVKMSDSDHSAMSISSKSYLTFIGIDFRGGYESIYMGHATHITFDHVHIGEGSSNYGLEVRDRSDYGILRYSVIDRKDYLKLPFYYGGNPNGGAPDLAHIADSNSWDIHDNYFSGDRHTMLGFSAHSGQPTQYNRIYHNEFAGTTEYSRWVGAASESTVDGFNHNYFYSNYIHDISQDTHMLGVNNFYAYNIVDRIWHTPYMNGAYPVAHSTPSNSIPSRNNTVVNNVFSRTDGVGIWEQNPDSSPSNKYINNIFVNNGLNPTCTECVEGSPTSSGSTWNMNPAWATYEGVAILLTDQSKGGNVFRNNLAYNDPSYGFATGRSVGYHPPGDPMLYPAYYISMSTFNTKNNDQWHEQVSGNFEANPLFKGGSGAAQFHLQSGSPACGKGYYVSLSELGPITDYFGNPIDTSHPDVGAVPCNAAK